jgi:hypothetical protein
MAVGEAVTTAEAAEVSIVGSTVAARSFTAALSEVVAPYSMAAGFEPRMCSAVVAFATAGSRSGTTVFTGMSSMERFTTRMMITPIIIPTAAVTSSGPITDRGASVTIAIGATTTGDITTAGIITTAFMGELSDDG